MYDWTIDLCTRFAKIAEVESLTQFNAVVRHLAIGSFRLEAATVGLAGVNLASVDSILVWQNNQILFVGLVRPAGTGSGGITVEATPDGERVVIEGVDMWGILAGRGAFPDPATEEPWAVSHDERTGVASTVAAEYIDANAGPGAMPSRQIAGLLIVDAEVGTSGTWSARSQPLDQLIARVCADGGITCRPTVLEDGTIQVTLTSPTDRSANTILSDQGDLTDTQWLRRPASATWVLGAGQGELTARTFTSADSGATGFDRIEQVYDNKNITTIGELARAVATQLVERAAVTTVSTRVAASAAQQFEWLTDYDIGDLVGVELASARYTVPVEAVSIEIIPGLLLVTPTLGVATPNRLTGLLNDVDGLTARLDRQLA